MLKNNSDLRFIREDLAQIKRSIRNIEVQVVGGMSDDGMPVKGHATRIQELESFSERTSRQINSLQEETAQTASTALMALNRRNGGARKIFGLIELPMLFRMAQFVAFVVVVLLFVARDLGCAGEKHYSVSINGHTYEMQKK